MYIDVMNSESVVNIAKIVQLAALPLRIYIPIHKPEYYSVFFMQMFRRKI